MKSVSITGASKGIGKYIALKLSKNYNVIKLFRSRLNKKKNITNIPGDTTDYKILKKKLSKLSKLDVLINKDYFLEYEKNSDLQIRSVSKHSPLPVKKLEYYKNNFIKLVREG
jgi:short-subunit dehydrogenase